MVGKELEVCHPVSSLLRSGGQCRSRTVGEPSSQEGDLCSRSPPCPSQATTPEPWGGVLDSFILFFYLMGTVAQISLKCQIQSLPP